MIDSIVANEAAPGRQGGCPPENLVDRMGHRTKVVGVWCKPHVGAHAEDGSARAVRRYGNILETRMPAWALWSYRHLCEPAWIWRSRRWPRGW